MNAASVTGGNDPKRDNFLAFTLPTAPERLDLFSLRADTDFALHWVDGLFNKGALRVTVESQSLNEHILRHFFIESRNRERLDGRRPLAFGFPVVAFHHGDALMAGPLLYWPMQMESSPNMAESWVFSHEADQLPQCNFSLLQTLEQFGGGNLSERLADAVAQRKPSGSELVRLILDVAKDSGLELDIENLTVQPCPDAETLNRLPAHGRLFWAGIIGLLPEYPPHSGVASLPGQTAVEPSGHPFGILGLDPWQAGALDHARRSRLTAVAGISGSGKTHMVADMMINALSNGQKCLVVSSRLPALREMQALLGRLGITTLHTLIRDVHYDQQALVALLRSAMAAAPAGEPFAADRFKLLVEKAMRLKDKLDAGHRASRKEVFGKFNWTETVGLFLRSQRQAGKELLGQQLYTQDFTFTYDEYEVLRRGIAGSQALFPRIKTLKHPLSALKGTLFTQKEKQAALAYIRQQLSAFSERAARLHHRYISTLNGYSDKLNDLYQTNYIQLREGIFRIKGMFADFSNQYGQDFERGSEGGLRLSGMISGRAKRILEGREHIRQAFEAMERAFAVRPPFDFGWLSAKERKSMPRIKDNLQELEIALGQWNDQLPGQVQEEVQRLGSKSVHPDLPYTTIVTELEQGLDTLLADINAAGLLEQALEHQALTLPKRLKYLEEVLESFDNIRLYLKDFEEFYEWQRHWLGLPENGRKVVRALVKVKPQDWVAALDSWYYFNCLTIQFSPELPAGEEAVSELDETLAALQPLVLSRIASLWEGRRETAVKEIRRAGRKTTLALSGGADASLSLADIFKETGNAVTDFFPIVFTVPSAAQALFQAGADFDYVIIDEAQAIPAAVGAPLLHLGKRALVLGDPGQQLHADDASLMGLYRAAGMEILPLRIIHQLKPGNLLQSAYPVDVADEDQRPFQLELTQVHGFFQEETGVNEKEAQAALQLLNTVQPTPQRTLPSIGIVCATPQQRDLISYYLLRIKQKNEPGADMIRQLERNGLGVFHLGEIHGQHFDEVILSVTFGPSGPRGEVSRCIEALNTPAGISQIAASMSRAALKVHALCSIDVHALQEMAGNTAAQGVCLLANYLLFISAFQHANEKEQRRIIERVSGLLRREEEAVSTPSVFHQEVAGALAAYIGKERIAEGESFGVLALPLVVRDGDNKNPVAVVRADGSFYDTPVTDWRWEHQLRKRMREKNIEYIPVWSAAWWRDAKEEARKLAGAILKL